MENHSTSRRRDLLVGSLVSTLVVCLAVWLDQGHRLQALPTSRPNPVPPQKPFVLPPDPVDTDVTVDPVKANTPRDPVPDIQDTPQPPNIERPFIQPIEPPLPAGPVIDVDKIPGGWISNGTGGGVFDPSMLDQQPVARHQARPVYPADLRRQGVEGSAVVDFIVDTDGNVRNATAIRATSPEFGVSAVSAVSKWIFTPGRRANHAVFTHLQVPIDFTLEKPNS
jgi:protein TonB